MPELESTGAMTRAMRAVPRDQGPRYLRWALVRDGKIVREAVLAPDRMLTIGGDVPCAGIGKPMPLAYFEDGEWRLSIRAGWTGRIGERELRPGEFALDANTRIVIDGVSVLLQLVERPPQRTKPGLTPAMRGGLFGRADYAFTAFVSGSLMLHFAFVVIVLESDMEFVSSYDMQLRRVEAIYPEIEPPEDAPDMTEPTDGEEVPDTTVSEGPSQDRGDDRPRTPSNANPRPTLSADETTRLAMADVQRLLGGISGESTGIDRLIDGADLAMGESALLEMIDGATMASNDPTLMEERHGNCVNCERPTGLEALAPGRGPRQVGEGPPVEEIVVVAPTGPEIFPPDDPPPLGCEASIVSRAVRMRMTAVQHCYERALLTDGPDVAGRIEIEMQVMPVGTVSNVHAVENTTGSQGLAACTVRSLENIRLFGCTPEEPFEVSYPLVFSRPQ